MLEVRKLVKTYPSPSGDLTVLDGVDLTLEPGQSASIVGASGNGKSTLLYVLGGLEPPTSGTVLLECVVLPDGSVGKVEVVRSLDSAFGLDQEAIKAAKQWRFAPGTRFGEPVAVLVTIELTFTLR